MFKPGQKVVYIGGYPDKGIGNTFPKGTICDVVKISFHTDSVGITSSRSNKIIYEVYPQNIKLLDSEIICGEK